MIKPLTVGELRNALKDVPDDYFEIHNHILHRHSPQHIDNHQCLLPSSLCVIPR